MAQFGAQIDVIVDEAAQVYKIVIRIAYRRQAAQVDIIRHACYNGPRTKILGTCNIIQAGGF